MTTDPNKAPVAANPSETQSLQSSLLKGGLTADSLLAIVSVLLQKEAKLAEKEAEFERKKAENDMRQREASNQFTIAKIENQKNCKHLKGGASRKRGQQKDYNVYAHTFADSKVYIKCNTCGAKWFENDTTEYLHRNGNAIPNWTGIGWREATFMLEESSNKASSSEIFRKTKVGATIPMSKGVEVPNLQI